MITIDERATNALRLLGNVEDGDLVGAARLSRLVGMQVVRMPGGGMALGKSAYDGTWFVLTRHDAGLLDAGHEQAWRAGRVHEDDGAGFTMGRDVSLGDAFGSMIVLPSPILEGGYVVDASVEGADEAREAIEQSLGGPRP